MYCRNCGNQIPNDAKFCNRCGTRTDVPIAGGSSNSNSSYNSGNRNTGSNGKKNSGSSVLVVVLALVIIGIILVTRFKSEGSKSVELPIDLPFATEATTEPAPQPPQYGWYEYMGIRYYYDAGQAVTGLQEIDNGIYYFYNDGSLAVNTVVEVNGNTLTVDGNGRMTEIVVGYMGGEWSSESYRYGGNGKSSVMLLETEVENCDRMTFYLSAEGNYGANVSGTWKIYIRSNGKWEHAQDVTFEQPSGSFVIYFDTLKNFDAITAYPTKRGNASYSVSYGLYDLHMVF